MIGLLARKPRATSSLPQSESYMRKPIAVFILALTCFLAGCGAKDLSRDDAARLIEDAPALSQLKSYVRAATGYQDVVAQQGLWTVENNTLSLSEPLGKELRQVEGDVLYLRSPVGVKVTVTGMSESPRGQNMKDVQFTWTHDGLPRLVRRIANEGGSGDAVLRLYDDGWHVESLVTFHSDAPLALSTGELAEQEADIKARAAQRAAELAKMAALWTPTTVVKTFVNEVGQGWRKTEITDSAVIFHTAPDPSGPWTREATYWYGLIGSLQRGYDGSYTGTFQLWNPAGRVKYATISFSLNYNSRTMSLDDFIRTKNEIGGAIYAARVAWRARFPDAVDEGIARERHWKAYYEQFDLQGAPLN